MPAVKFIARLDFDRKISFFKVPNYMSAVFFLAVLELERKSPSMDRHCFKLNYAYLRQIRLG